MKEVEKVSIGGYAFTLDKEALEEASRYLSELETHYLGREGGREIMEGIEERMAELLLERCRGGAVASVRDIRELIAVIGRPETIEAEDPEAGEADRAAETPRRKLYRDVSRQRIAGVCSGLSNYFNIDVALVRVAFVALAVLNFFALRYHDLWCFAVPILYVILWIAMPAARTAQERWQMKGESGTAEGIRRAVESGAREVGQAADNVRKSGFLGGVGKAFLFLVGVVLLLVGVSGIASLSVVSLKGQALFGTVWNGHAAEWARDYPAFFDLLQTPWVLVLAALAVILPFLGMIYGGTQLLFGFKSPSWRPGLVIFVLWLVILVILCVLACAGYVSGELVSV